MASKPAWAAAFIFSGRLPDRTIVAIEWRIESPYDGHDGVVLFIVFESTAGSFWSESTGCLEILSDQTTADVLRGALDMLGQKGACQVSITLLGGSNDGRMLAVHIPVKRVLGQEHATVTIVQVVQRVAMIEQ